MILAVIVEERWRFHNARYNYCIGSRVATRVVARVAASILAPEFPSRRSLFIVFASGASIVETATWLNKCLKIFKIKVSIELEVI